MDQTPEAELLSASRLVASLIAGGICFQQFVNLYDNYFYAAALDGHEDGSANAAFISANQPLVEFHHRVQDVLDRVYSPPSGAAAVPLPDGRLSGDEAERRIVALAEGMSFRRELEALQDRLQR